MSRRAPAAVETNGSQGACCADPSSEASGGRASRVVTLGGGHGQSMILSALRHLVVDVDAVVSTADDGGCSGHLRGSSGMPPPGDVRRCLTALAVNRALATRFEQRMGTAPGRSAGNLVLALVRERLGSLQAAADWAANLLGARGRVLPVSESPGTLVVYDAEGRVLSGESRIEAVANSPLVASVHGSTAPNPDAVNAIAAADWLLVGPGSFFTSILAVISSVGIARACVASRARCCFLANLVDEGDQTANWPLERYVRVLKDHIMIASLGGDLRVDVLAHDASGFAERQLDDGTRVLAGPMAQPGARTHDADLVVEALVNWFGFERRVEDVHPSEDDAAAEAVFEQELARAAERFGHHVL